MSLPSLYRLSAAVLVTATLAGPVQSQPFSPVFSPGEPDYLFPSPTDLRARAEAVRSLAAPAFGQGERVSYRAFNNQTYELTRFQGRHVELLLPDTWTGPGALSEEQIRAFVDRTDLIYQNLLDLVGTPPGGEGLLPVAIVPETCGLGCGFLGVKGVEMQDDPGLRSFFWQEIAAGMPSGVLVHEMTHNFDVFYDHLAYTPDHAHSWTSFITSYYFVYTQEGGLEIAPDEIVSDWLTVTASYFKDLTADWEACVKDGLCRDRGISPELSWGGLGFRLALLDGPQSVRGFMAFLRQYRQSNPPPVSALERNDLFIEALAAGSRRNLGCVADAWRWPVSDSLRQRMGQLYRGPNPHCQDSDRDGFSPLLGDCDDRRATTHPGAAERTRRVDDDCDGRIDETVWREPVGGDLPTPVQLVLPAEVAGTAGISFDSDELLLRMKAPGRVLFELCSGQEFFAQILPRSDAGEERDILRLFGGGCSQKVYSLSAGIWRFEIHLGEGAGGDRYSVGIRAAAPWPEPRSWARTAIPRRNGNRFTLTALTVPSPLLGPPTEIRFWVSGQGIVGTIPYSRAAAFVWTPPAGLDLTGLSYRAQVLVRGVPAARITLPQPFISP